MIRFDTPVPPLHFGDSCSVEPIPAPCLNYIQQVAASQPDNTAMWGIFLIGIVAGFVLAFVLTAPAAYKLGRGEGWQSAHQLMSRKQRPRRSNYQHAARKR